MKKGITYSSYRTFCVAFSGAVGVFLGVLIIFSLIGAISTTTGREIERSYTLEIAPNTEGVRKVLSKKSPVVLQLYIAGLIGSERLNMQTVREQLQESREGDLKDDRVKAILLRINTPGGTVTDSDGIYRALLAYKEQYNVPIYAYVDGLCASGGMYVASAADKVFASEISLIGSVGVLSPAFLNFSKLIEKIGVEALTLSEGKGKDDMNPLRPWKPGEDEMYKSIIKYYYDHFVNLVVKARPQIGKEKLIQEYGASIFPAEKAKEYGFIDGDGYSRNQALKLLLKEIGIEDDYYQVVELKEENWVSRLFSGQSSLLEGTMKHKLELPQEFDPQLSGKFLYLYAPDRDL